MSREEKKKRIQEILHKAEALIGHTLEDLSLNMEEENEFKIIRECLRFIEDKYGEVPISKGTLH